MTRLVDLPNEVVVMILDHVLPDDLVNFSITCKHIHSLATRSLRVHRALQRKYFNFRWNHPYSRKNEGFARLQELLRNPLVGFYVKSLEIFLPYLDEEYKFSKHDTVFLNDAISQYFSFGKTQRENFVEKIHHQDCQAICALLIMMLPNLEKFRVEAGLPINDYIHAAMQKTPKFSANTPKPLSRLKKLKFDVEPDWMPDIYFASFAPLLTLPSLKSLNCFEITEKSILNRVQHSVNVTKLKLDFFQMNEKYFFEFLKHFKKLRIFILTSGLGDLDPFWVYSAFYAHSRHTLETLNCSGDEEQTPSPLHSAMGSFVDFDQLKKIDINFCCLSITPHVDDRSMAEIFPSSIQHITLRRIEFCQNDYAFIHDKLFNGSMSLLSKLRRIVLDGTHEIDPDPTVDTLIKIDQLKRKGELAGGFFGYGTMEKRPRCSDYHVVISLYRFC